MSPVYRGRRVYPWLAGALLVVFLLQILLEARLKSPTFDEPGHLAAGLSYIATDSMVANPQHPPLLKELSGLAMYMTGVRWRDTAATRALLRGAPGVEWPVGNEILAGDPDGVLFTARLPMILVAVLGGLAIWLWGRRLVGEAAALGALFLYTLSPTILAHAYLVTTDVGCAAFETLFLFALWHYLRQPDWKRLVLCGLALGALLTTKFSAVTLLPVTALLMAVQAWRKPAAPEEALKLSSRPKGRPSKKPRVATQDRSRVSGQADALLRQAGVFALLLVGAFLVIQAVYFFPSDSTIYLRGLESVNADHDPTYRAFLGGRLEHRYAGYFAAVWLLKEPLAGLLLVAIGLAAVVRSRTLTLVDKLFLLAPPLVQFVATSWKAENFGIRYLIPALPCAYLIGGFGLASLAGGGRHWRRVAAGVLCAWLAVAGLGIWPDHLSYFNEAACLPGHASEIGWDGGSRCGTLWLDEHNVDWGQGLKQLKSWMDRHAPGRTVRLAYLGSVPPGLYGLNFEKVTTQDLMRPPVPGLYAVSAHFVARAPALRKQAGGAGAWLPRLKPVAVVGHALYVYEVAGGL